MKKLTQLLSLALDYPGPEQRKALALAWADWQNAQDFSFELSADLKSELNAEIQHLLEADLLEIQTSATDLFDLGKGTSLRLFEHVHGDSRARGQAMVDLLNFFRAHGLELAASELPDHLAVVLEATSYLPQEKALTLLAEMTPVLELLCLNHQKGSSPWIHCLRTVYHLSGANLAELAQLPQPETPAEDMDALWAEPEISFGTPETCTGAKS